MPVGFGASLDDEETSVKELLDAKLEEEIFVVEFVVESEGALAEEVALAEDGVLVDASLEDVSDVELVCPLDSLPELGIVEGDSLDSGEMSL